jgi:starvation-inducible DNA-binding protein
MSIQTGLQPQENKRTVELLLKMARAYFVLQVKTLGFHWNVTGSDFIVLHQFFEDVYKGLLEGLDEIAERIRVLGAWAPGCVAELSKDSCIQDIPEVHHPVKMLELLAVDHGRVIQELRKILNILKESPDEGTRDLLIEHLRTFEKRLWMLHSLIQHI